MMSERYGHVNSNISYSRPWYVKRIFKFIILRTYIVCYYLTLKFCSQAEIFKESDKKYAKF